MILPKNVSYIINKLEEEGYEAYAVGGCVRDTMLGREPEDWDITTSAKPLEIKRIFKKTIDTGIQHGTVTVMLDHIGYEVTTYRIDGEYEDSRHPKSVEFTGNLKLDLERRDFTINAMAYNDTAGLVDEFDGERDLKDGIIRCVGNTGKRFDEDALRMLRAVRFSGQLGFEIEPNTRQAIVDKAGNLGKISAERIRVELTKLLASKDAGQIREAYRTGMTRIFLPELDNMMEVEQYNPHHIYTVGEHCIRSVEIMNSFFGLSSGKWDETIIPDEVQRTAENLAQKMSRKQHDILVLTMLLHDIAKPVVMTKDEDGVGHFYGHPQKSEEMARNIMKRLTFDNETVSTVRKLIRFHDYRMEGRCRPLRHAVSKIGVDIMPMLFLVQYADILAQNPDKFEDKLLRQKEAYYAYNSIIKDKSPLSIKDLAVTGKDLIEAGVTPGPGLGKMLERLLEYVLDEPDKNEKGHLIMYVKNLNMNRNGEEYGVRC